VEQANAAVLHYDYDAAPTGLIAAARRLRVLCEQLHTSLPAAALHFPLAHPAVRCVLPGLANKAEVEQALAWREQAVPATLWTALRDAGLTAPLAPLPL
jgi:D-threo-aldose 1-dehydrogenase